MGADFAQCRRMVEAEDGDRALALTFAPAETRDALAALYAFDIKTRAIRDRISEPMPGEIRLQWWRDVLSSPGEGAAGHPVAAALSDVIETHALPRAAFDRFLEARIFDLYDDPMPDRTSFEGYAGETAATLIVLAATVLDARAANAIGDAAGHAGVAEAAATALKHLPLHRSRGQTFLPADLLTAVGGSPEALIRGDEPVAARAVAAMAAYGREHAARFAALLPTVPRSVRAAFVPAGLAMPLFDRATKAGASAATEPLAIGPVARAWRAWRVMRA